MQNPLIKKARARRLAALASLPNRADNIVSLSRLRADREAAATSVMFVSMRAKPAAVRLVA